MESADAIAKALMTPKILYMKILAIMDYLQTLESRETPGILFHMYAKNEFKYIRFQYERKEKIHGL